MFTGIIEDIAKVKNINMSKDGASILFEANNNTLEDLKIGDSIAINGACLTATKIKKNAFEADLAPETLKRCNFANIKVGDLVNLERALKINGRLDGHLVSGHIDGMGTIKSKEEKGNAIIFKITPDDKKLLNYIVEKGSVAIDGISLTVNNIEQDAFLLSIIPHTLKLTTLNKKKTGDIVNIECDMIGKYIEKFMNKDNKSKIDESFLAKFGFLD